MADDGTPPEIPWLQPLAGPVWPARRPVPVGLIVAPPWPDPARYDWLAPLSDPVRSPPLLHPSRLNGLWLVKAAPFPETTSVDRWYQPLSLPVRLLPGLRTGLQSYDVMDWAWGPPPAPAPDPIPAPVLGPTAQTIYAMAASNYQPAFAGQPAMFLPNGQSFIVGDALGRPITATAAVNSVRLLFDLTSLVGSGGVIERVSLALLEQAGVDPVPQQRLIGPLSVVSARGRQRQGAQQALYNLVSGGAYVAVLSVRFTNGNGYTIIAPFAAA